MSFLRLISIIAFSAWSLASCMPSSSISEATPESNIAGTTATQITDQRGKTITLPDTIERIVTIPIPAPFLLATLDGNARKLVGIHASSQDAVTTGIMGTMFPDMKTIPSNFVSQDFQPNVEELLKLQPDVVFQWANRGENIINPLEDAGITVIGLNYGTQEDLETWINIMGQVLNKSDKAQQLINYHRSHLEKIKQLTAHLSETEKPRVLYISPVTNLRAFGSNTYNDAYLSWTGAMNVASPLNDMPNVTMEQVLAWDPEIIYIGNFGPEMPEDILENKLKGQDWSQVTAVKNQAVYKVPMGGYRWDPPSQESPLMWYWLLQAQHPDLFKDSLPEMMKAFYQDYYGYTLTKENINELLFCQTNNQHLPSCQ